MTGYLYITSYPVGAKILIDNVDTLHYTPMLIRDILEGDYTYSLKKLGYVDAAGTFSILLDQITSVESILKKLDDGCVCFHSVPTKAEIYINDVDINMKTPSYVCGNKAPIGAAFRMDGNVTITNSECYEFKSKPPGASIFIDDIDTGYVTPKKICDLSVGTHTFSLRGIVETYKKKEDDDEKDDD